ncbi:unnamed protein product [Polarella glacialis]|uniref:Uncharacterized protein n=1 Tax=Polarella glacialis TaxID=89957 RepID=A0A813LNX6_POLGL|nr:unnamed protein product [Polarella glacialis]
MAAATSSPMQAAPRPTLSRALRPAADHRRSCSSLRKDGTASTTALWSSLALALTATASPSRSSRSSRRLSQRLGSGPSPGGGEGEVLHGVRMRLPKGSVVYLAGTDHRLTRHWNGR